MTDPIDELLSIGRAITADYAQIQSELAEIKKLLGPPTYVVDSQSMGGEAWEELKKALCKQRGPGTIIPLSTEAFELYKKLEPCPPRNP